MCEEDRRVCNKQKGTPLMAASFAQSPRPVPVISLSETPFSQRKKTPARGSRPPRPPAKSCPPVSRVFLTPRERLGPQLISFKSERKREEDLASPYYNAQVHKSFFEQCFDSLQKIGEGSFGEVFKVCSKEDGKLYAIKRSHQRFRGQWDRRQKLSEVEKHERLPPHENCVRFHKAWEERQHLYIQTELCDMSLAEYADIHGRLSEREMWILILELARGLSHLHNNGVCHFDIKPANIFLSKDGITWKLGDFGLCTSDDHGFRGAMEGDAKYLAPELMQEEFGKPADVFSLGISLVELACDLELPSGGANWHLLRNGQLPSEFTKGLSPELISLLSAMMHPRPECRPTINQVLCNPSVRWASHRLVCRKMYNRLTSVFRVVYVGLIALLMFIVSLFTSGKADKTPTHTLSSPPCGVVSNEDSFSDDEDEHYRRLVNHSSDDGSDSKAKFNRSWINNSPMRYPSPVYAGPPIPLNFDDSSSFSEGSPARIIKSSSPKVNLNHSFYRHDDSTFSVTPNSKPFMSSPVVIDNSRNRNIGIEPKNLMDMFSDSSD